MVVKRRPKRSSTPSKSEIPLTRDSVGRPKHEKVMITTDSQDVYVGDTIVRDRNLML